jgi:hypothetical protein
MFNVVHTIESAFRAKFSELRMHANVTKRLFDEILPNCDHSFLFISHPQHASYLSHKITKLYILMRIFYAVKFSNRDVASAKLSKCNQSVRRSEKSRKMQKILHK